MKLSPKQLARSIPIHKTDGEGVTWLVGYRRRSRSRKAGKEFWLKNPVRLGPDGTPDEGTFGAFGKAVKPVAEMSNDEKKFGITGEQPPEKI